MIYANADATSGAEKADWTFGGTARGKGDQGLSKLIQIRRSAGKAP